MNKVNPNCAMCILFHCILNIQNMVHILNHKENIHTVHVLCKNALKVIFALFPSNLSITHMHTVNHLFQSPKKKVTLSKETASSEKGRKECSNVSDPRKSITYLFLYCNHLHNLLVELIYLGIISV